MGLIFARVLEKKKHTRKSNGIEKLKSHGKVKKRTKRGHKH